MNTLKKWSLLSMFTAMLASGFTTNLMAQTMPQSHVAMVSAENKDYNEATFEAAMQAYEQSHWLEAYHVLTDLADWGHVEAARIAGQMQRFGMPLYGMQFSRRSITVAQQGGCN